MIIESIEFNSFSQFSHDIIPNNIVSAKYKDFAFRGESSCWSLLPRTLRTGETTITSELMQIRLEFSLLSNFYINANNHGLYLPASRTLSNSPINREDYDLMFEILSSNNYHWLPADMIEVAALAQHYGLPTRMLDFTFNIFTALYFASSEACQKYEESHNGYMVIWAVNYKKLSFIKYTDKKIPLLFSVPIYTNNPNLRAQKGLLVYWDTIYNHKADIKIDKQVDRTPIDEKLKDYKSDEPLLYKFLIPKSNCVEIFDLLFRLEYHAATLFPGYSGITKMFKEKARLDQLKN